MKKLFALLPVIAGGLMLAGCATPFEVDDVNTIIAAPTPTTGTAFNSALFDEYKAYAINEAKVEFEWDDASIFARKGLAAANGDSVAPEMVANWSIPDARIGELSAAHDRLIGYLGNGSTTRVPAAAAKAQVKFDCWVEEEHEGDTKSDCRAQFLATEPLLVPPMAAAPAPKIVKTFVVYFNTAKADITTDAKRTLTDVVKAQTSLQPANIYVSGYTDTVGSSTYNLKLSDKRAHAVEGALGNLGVKTSRFDVKAYGKDKPAVPTADNVQEGKNRRVEIYFEK